MMTRRSVFYFLGFLLLSIATTAPTKRIDQKTPSHNAEAKTSAALTVTSKYTIEDMQLLQPHFITLEDFESLLRRAGELFRPNAYLVDDSVATSTPPPQMNPKPMASVTHSYGGLTTAYRQIQPPAIQPYNFYMPLFEQENAKLDAKSKRMEHILPPPVPVKGMDQTNYYSAKPKKLPKKFYANTKQVNINWLNAFEKEALTDDKGQLPKAVYLLHDERNRINFDDSFFGVDMQVKIPNNQPHQEDRDQVSKSAQGQEEEFLNQREESGEEDLVASAARQTAHSVQRN